MSNAPEQIWAFYAPHIADDENGATIVAYETQQFGSHKYIREDLCKAQIAAAYQDALTALGDTGEQKK